MFEYKPSVNKDNIHEYLHPIEIKIREEYLEIVKKHGNGLWAFEELEYKVYIDRIDEYEAMNENEKYILNNYMKVFRCLYK